MNIKKYYTIKFAIPFRYGTYNDIFKISFYGKLNTINYGEFITAFLKYKDSGMDEYKYITNSLSNEIIFELSASDGIEAGAINKHILINAISDLLSENENNIKTIDEFFDKQIIFKNSKYNGIFNSNIALDKEINYYFNGENCMNIYALNEIITEDMEKDIINKVKTSVLYTKIDYSNYCLLTVNNLKFKFEENNNYSNDINDCNKIDLI